MKTYRLRGVPQSVATDGWWLSSAPPRHPPSKGGDTQTPRLPLRGGALAALVALADLLLWQVEPGLSMALFGLAVLVFAWGVARRGGTAGLVFAAFLFLPVIEQVQALSVMFWLAGLALGAGWIALARWPGLAAGLRFLLLMPGLVMSDARQMVASTSGTALRDGMRTAYLGWFLPLGFGLLFTSLLIQANPMFAGWIDTAFNGPPLLEPARLAFWLGAALFGWPFLSLRAVIQRLSLPFARVEPGALPAVFNAAAIRRSLVGFNIVFAVQTISDIAVFSGGASLPAGMSYAEYAHRGAYPLLATALLAGLFALAARPFTCGNRALRAALLTWMAQTLLLVISSLIRLESYVSVYGLTHLRLSALVWMGVVAVGITLVIGQILRDKNAAWLLRRCAMLGVATLYLCSFSSFSATIARYNLTHDVVRDAGYLCRLDSAALPAIVAHERSLGKPLCAGSARPRLTPPKDWREWGFRDWRTARSLSAISARQEPAWPIF